MTLGGRFARRAAAAAAAVAAMAAAGCAPERFEGAPCAATSECMRTLVCHQGACRAPCASDTECGRDARCERSSEGVRVCIEGARTDAGGSGG